MLGRKILVESDLFERKSSWQTSPKDFRMFQASTDYGTNQQSLYNTNCNL